MDLNNSVDVSVVIPVHDQARFVLDAVQSVIEQVDVGVEVIIVDDGSEDDLHSELHAIDFPRLTLIKQGNLGAGAARNVGAGHSVGRYIAFLDADDLLERSRLRAAVSVLSQSSAPTMSFAMIQEFLDSSINVNHEPVPEVRKMRGISASGCVMERTTFDSVGLFDVRLKTGEFMDWFIRAEKLGVKSDVDQQVLVRRRIHEGNRDRKIRDTNQDYARVLLHKVQRERQG